ncbi:MAG: alpha/beta hydrolase [Coriobacteriales bacterium]|nr:alpha/beta hydrolase [Coriobacteriales bacterium]
MARTKRCFEEYVAINGIQQYLLHFPCRGGEIMLVLHGGPGQSATPFAHHAEPPVPVCHAVYYDQRGTGKTLRKNPTKGSDVTAEKLLEDLAATVEYLKHAYQKDKIIIHGHSWGSVLGLLYAHQHPENVLFYIGSGQVVDCLQGERITLKKLKQLACDDARDQETLSELEDGLADAKDFLLHAGTLMKLKKKHGLGISTKNVVRIALRSPVFGIADVRALFRAQKLSIHLLDFLSAFSAWEITELNTPAYFIHGENDGQIPIEQVMEYFDGLVAPDKGFYPIADAGHICVADNLKGVLCALSEIQGRFSSHCREKSQ